MAQIALNYSAAQINAAIAKINSLVTVIEGNIVQLYNGSTAIYPLTKAEAVFFDGDTSKTLDTQFSQLEQKSLNVGDLYGGTIYEKTFENIDNSTATTYSNTNILIHAGCKIRVSYNSSVNNLDCVFGVRFSDNTTHYNIGSLLRVGDYIDYIPEKDVISISLYIVTLVSNIDFFTIITELLGVTKDINKLNQDINLLSKNVYIPYATQFLFSKMSIDIYRKDENSSDYNVSYKYLSTNGDSYIHHTKGYIYFTTNIERTYTISTGIYILYAIQGDIILTTNYNDIPYNENVCILEIFYAYKGSVNAAEWSSEFISKNYEINSNCSLVNPKQNQKINSLLSGGVYSETYSNINLANRTIYLKTYCAAGQKVDIWFESPNQISCILGVNFIDGSQDYSIAVLYSGDKFTYTADKDIYNIAFYFSPSQSEIVSEIVFYAKTISIVESLSIDLTSMVKATSLFYGTGHFEFDQTNKKINVSFLRTSPSNPMYIYHEYGYIGIYKDIIKELSYQATNNNIIYFDIEEKDIKVVSSAADLPKKYIIFEVFYNYSGNITRISWTSPFITKNLNWISSNNDTYCCFSNPKVLNDLRNDIDNLNLKLNKNNTTPKSIKIFQRVGCIGDSYTAGYISTSNGLLDKSVNNAWPHYMEGLTNNKYDNWGISGSTAKGWVLGAAALNQVKAVGNKCQAYIIGLMINDRNNASWNSYYTPVGESSDIGTDADTYYAYYYKLIQEVVSVNPQAKIFCANNPKWSINDSYNQAVNNIVNYCYSNSQNVFLIDLAGEYASYYQDSTFNADYINGHYTSIGYEYMAECYLMILSDIINKRVSDFQDIAYIPFDEVSA